jgi:hypothetical protein
MRKAAEAKAAMDALNKSAADANATQLAGEEKLVAARRNEITALKEETAAAKVTADAYKVYNVQALYGGRSDMQSHLSDMERQLQYETLLNRQRWLGFTTPQQAFAWRQNEYNQRLLMNRAEWAGYATADQYLQFVQRQTSGQRDLNAQMLRQSELYKTGADAAVQYWNAVQGQAHKTTSGVSPVITPRVDLGGVQRAEAALAGIPDTVTTQMTVDDDVAKAELAAWTAALRIVPPRVDVVANFDDAAAMAKATSFFAFLKEHRNFGTTETLTNIVATGAAGGGGGPPRPPVTTAPGASPEPDPNDANASAAAINNLAKSLIAEHLASDGAASSASITAADYLQMAMAANKGSDAVNYLKLASIAAQVGSDKAAQSAKDAASGFMSQAAAARTSGQAFQFGQAALLAFNQAQKNAASGVVQVANAQGMSALQLATATQKQKLSNAAVADSIPLMSKITGFWSLFTVQVQLWGGAMTALGLPHMVAAASGLHIIIDSLIEIIAVLVPAAVAFTAFGVAAIPTVMSIYQSMRAVQTTSKAFQETLYPMTGGFQAMAKAVQPEVYTLFGEALVVMNNGTGQFTKVAVSAGKALDMLGARIAVALNSPGTGKFLDSATKDLTQITDVFGNIFGIFGNILKVMPGYAEILLGIVDKVTAGIEHLTSGGLVQWAVGAFLAFHGFVLWAGLGATAAVALGNSIVGLAAKFGLAEAGALAFNAVEFGAGIKAAIAGAGLFAAELVTLSSAEDIAAAGALTLEGVMTALGAINPLVWIGAAVAAIAFLVVWLTRGTASTNQFADAAQKAIATVPVSQVGVTLVRQYADATAAMSKMQASSSISALIELQAINQLQQGHKALTAAQLANVSAAQKTLQEYGNQAALLPVIAQDQKAYADLLKASGGNLSLVTAAGISWSDWLSASASQRAQYTIEIQAQADEQRALGLGVGQTAAALNAQTNEFMTGTVPAMQKVTQAEDALLNVMLGGEQAIVGFQQAIQTMGKDAQTAGAHVGDLHNQSLALTSDFFGSVIPALQKTSDAMRMQGATQAQLTAVLATGASEALKYAGNNLTAKTIMVDLINNALGPGTVSLKNLDSWVRKNGTSLNGMAQIMAQVTVKSSQLAGVLQNNLNVMLAQAAANALGGQRALDQFAQGVLNGDRSATQLAQDGGAKVLKMFLQMYQNSAPAAKKAFVDWAENGLGLGQQAALDLWNTLTNNLNPALSNSGNVAHIAAGKIDNDFVKSLQAVGFNVPTTAVTNFSNAILATGDSSSRTANARSQLIKDLENAGVQAGAAKTFVNNLQTQIDLMHGKTVGVDIVGSGSGTITFAEQNIKNAQTGLLEFHQTGGEVGGSGGPTQDNIPIMASSGEWVINAASVNKLQRDYGPDVMPALNRYASGGLVDSHGVLSGIGQDFMGTAMHQAGQAAADTAALSMVADMKAKVAAANAAALAAAGGAYLGPGSASYAADITTVLNSLGLPLSLVGNWLSQIATESGGNLNAVNLTDSNAAAGHPSVGLLQLIPGTFAAYAGPYRNTPPLVNYGGGVVSEDPMAQIYAAIHYALARYGTGMGAVIGHGHGYAVGGPIGGGGVGRPFPPISGGSGSPPSGAGPVIAAIKRYTADPRIRESMALGAYLETGFGLSAHRGEGYGPFLINLGKNPAKGNIKAAEDPNWAAKYAVQWYDRAFAKVGGAPWHTGHDLQGALSTANIAEHMAHFMPGSPALSTSKAAGGWTSILAALGLLNSSTFNTGGTSGPGISAVSQDYVTQVAALEKDWPAVVAAYSILAHEPKPKSAKGAKLWPGWLSDVTVGSHAEGHITSAVAAIKANHPSASVWNAMLGATGGGLLDTVLTGHIPAKKYWPTGKPSPQPWVGVSVYPKQLGDARNRFNTFLKAAQAAQRDWTLLSAPGEGPPVAPGPHGTPPPDTTATPVNVAPWATLGGPAIPVYPGSYGSPAMGFAAGGQVGKVTLANVAGMMSGFSGGGLVPMSMGTVPMGHTASALRMASGGEVSSPRVLSEGASATRVGLNVENMTINNPVPEPASQGITRAANRLSFLGGRGP